MPRGIVKRYESNRGFGFITTEDGVDLFFHHTAVDEADVGSLRAGQAVEFVVGESPRGSRAESVRAVKPGA